MKQNVAMVIREKIISKNPNFCAHDIPGDGYCHKYLHDKERDINYIWYKRCREYSGWAINPDQEDFNELLSKCDDEELIELIVNIFKDKVSCLERRELIEFIYGLYKDNLEYA